MQLLLLLGISEGFLEIKGLPDLRTVKAGCIMLSLSINWLNLVSAALNNR